MTENKQFVEFSKPFIDACKTIFETMVFTKLDAAKPEIKDSNVSRGDVSALLGLSGDVTKNDNTVPYRAMLVLSFPMETYLKTASAMLMEEYTEYNKEIADVGAEICNMIMGNAKRTLVDSGYECNMAVPSIVEGKAHTISYPPKTTVVIIPVSTAHGPFFIELCYTEG